MSGADELARARARRGLHDPAVALGARLAYVRDESEMGQTARLRAFLEPPPGTPVPGEIAPLRGLAQTVLYTIPVSPRTPRSARTYVGSTVAPGNRVGFVVALEGVVAIGYSRASLPYLGAHNVTRWPAAGAPTWLSDPWTELGPRRPMIARERHDVLSAWAFRDAPDRIIVREGIGAAWARSVLTVARVRVPSATYRVFARLPIPIGALVGVHQDGSAAPMNEGMVFIGVAGATHGDGTVDVHVRGSMEALESALAARPVTRDGEPRRAFLARLDAWRHDMDAMPGEVPDGAALYSTTARGAATFGSTNEGRGTIRPIDTGALIPSRPFISTAEPSP